MSLSYICKTRRSEKIEMGWGTKASQRRPRRRVTSLFILSLFLDKRMKTGEPSHTRKFLCNTKICAHRTWVCQFQVSSKVIERKQLGQRFDSSAKSPLHIHTVTSAHSATTIVIPRGFSRVLIHAKIALKSWNRERN